MLAKPQSTRDLAGKASVHRRPCWQSLSPQETLLAKPQSTRDLAGKASVHRIRIRIKNASSESRVLVKNTVEGLAPLSKVKARFDRLTI